MGLVSNKRDFRKLIHSFHHERKQQKDGICELGSRLSPDAESASVMILDFPVFRIMGVNVCCL